MNVIRIILKQFLIGLVRNRTNFGFMIILPIVFTLIFGVIPNMSGNHTSISVVDHDHSALSRAIVSQMNRTDGYSARVIPDRQAETDLRDMQASLVMTLPAGLEQEALAGESVKIIWQPSPNAGSADTAAALMQLHGDVNQWILTGGVSVSQAKMRGATDEQKLVQAFESGMYHAAAIHSPIETSAVYLVGEQVQQNPLTKAQGLIIGFATMFIIFSVFGSTSSIHQERAKGTWSRFKASPASKAQILIGYGAGYFLVGWVQFLIMDVAGYVMFGNGIPLTLWTVLIVSLYVLAVVGAALCVAGLVKTGEQHMMIGSFVGTATSMLGGAYWPIDLEPTWMQRIAWFVPQSWAIDAFKGTAIGLASIGSVALPLGVLAGFAIVFFGAGMLQMKYS